MPGQEPLSVLSSSSFRCGLFELKIVFEPGIFLDLELEGHGPIHLYHNISRDDIIKAKYST